MRPDLDNLRREIERLLAAGGYTVFRARSRFNEGLLPILWDTQQNPNPAEFLDTALAVGIKFIVFHSRGFDPGMLDEAFEKLEAANLPRERHRELERELKRLRGFEGFTSAVELSFDFDGNTYLFEAAAPWYDEYLDLLDGLDEAIEEDEEPPPPMSGYFSQN